MDHRRLSHRHPDPGPARHPPACQAAAVFASPGWACRSVVNHLSSGPDQRSAPLCCCCHHLPGPSRHVARAAPTCPRPPRQQPAFALPTHRHRRLPDRTWDLSSRHHLTPAGPATHACHLPARRTSPTHHWIARPPANHGTRLTRARNRSKHHHGTQPAYHRIDSPTSYRPHLPVTHRRLSSPDHHPPIALAPTASTYHHPGIIAYWAWGTHRRLRPPRLLAPISPQSPSWHRPSHLHLPPSPDLSPARLSPRLSSSTIAPAHRLPIASSSSSSPNPHPSHPSPSSSPGTYQIAPIATIRATTTITLTP